MLPLLTCFGAAAAAQGVTTAGIRGTISSESGRGVDGRVRVVNDATGFSADVRAFGGRYFIEGLEPGGPYTVTAIALGFAPERRRRVFLELGELREMSFAMKPNANRMDTITILSGGGSEDRGAHFGGGAGMSIGEEMLQHLPTLNRDLYDFVRLVPQISTKVSLSNPGFSAGGVGFRFNEFLINGTSERTLSGGVSSAFAGARSIPLDAVAEYQVLLSPYDVRYGDFAGALVNAVTKSGTNWLTGSVFASGRNDRLARRSGSASATRYDRAQYGFSAGGPIIPNRLHFFIATELQDFTSPAAGPYVGQPSTAERPVPVVASDLARLDAIMRNYGLTSGSANAIENGNPLRNLFTRLDLAIPMWRTRMSLWNNYSASEVSGFSRAASDSFPLSNYRVIQTTLARTTTVQLHTALPRAGGGHNELLISYRSGRLDVGAPVQQPIVRVSVPAVSGGSITVNMGTPENAQGGGIRPSALNVKENLTLPFGSRHIVTAGADVERFRIDRLGVPGSFGAWSFPSLDALQEGVADRYDVRIDLGSATAPISGTHYAAYAGDQWTAGRRVSVTAGVRGEVLAIDQRAPYRLMVDSMFGRRTDEMPRRRLELSPRVGFTWIPSPAGEQRVRGGVGVFTARYPLAWAQTALSSYGVGGTLRCNRLGASLRPPPSFTPDYRSAPTACTGGATITTSFPGDLDLLDRNLRMMRVARASLSHQTRLPGTLLLTNEALFTRGVSDFVFVNLNLPEPRGADRYGRVIYGTIAPSGVVIPRSRSPFSEAIDLRNTASNRSFQLSTRMEKIAATGMRGSVSYTFSHVRDVQTPLRVNTRGTVVWATARVTSGRHDQLTPGISANDIPHRIVATGTYVAPWTNRRTEMSFYYVGESGRPFTHIAYGTLGRGDLNADGSSANDPIYVPRNAFDTAEIKFSGLSESAGADNSPTAQAGREAIQQNAFAQFINLSRCLRRQRGHILERNSCREPWSSTTIASVRQAFPVAGRSFEVDLQIFNVLNLLNARWGLRREASPALLEHVAQTADPAQKSRPIFRFNAKNAGWTTLPEDSGFQLQLGARYRF